MRFSHPFGASAQPDPTPHVEGQEFAQDFAVWLGDGSDSPTPEGEEFPLTFALEFGDGDGEDPPTPEGEEFPLTFALWFGDGDGEDPQPKPPPVPDTALSRLVTQFRDKPRIKALLKAIAAQVQDVSDTADDLREKRWLDSAEGAQLDGLGRILGLARGAWDDDRYRAQLRVRIRILLADGTPENIIETLALLANGESVQLIETYPAELRIVVGGAVSPDVEAALRETAFSIKPPGVALWLESGSNPDEPEFAFDGGDGAGFGEGVLRGVIYG